MIITLLTLCMFFINYDLFLLNKLLQSFQPIVIPPKRNATPTKDSTLISLYIPNTTDANETINEAITNDFAYFTFFIILIYLMSVGNESIDRLQVTFWVTTLSNKI